MNELDNLETIEVNSRRGGGQNFDIFHDEENQKFTVSDAFYTANNMNDNGLTAHYSKANNSVYLSVQPNEDSVSYKGREGYDKGKEFTASSMSGLLSKVGLEGNLSLEDRGQKDGATYFLVSQVENEDSSEDTETINEDLAAEEQEEVEMGPTEEEAGEFSRNV